MKHYDVICYDHREFSEFPEVTLYGVSAMRILHKARQEYYNALTVYGSSMPAYYYAMYNVELCYKQGIINSSCYNYIRKQIYNLYKADY